MTRYETGFYGRDIPMISKSLRGIDSSLKKLLEQQPQQEATDKEIRVPVDQGVVLKGYRAPDPDYPGIFIDLEGPEYDHATVSVEVKGGLVNVYVWELGKEDWEHKFSFAVPASPSR